MSSTSSVQCGDGNKKYAWRYTKIRSRERKKFGAVGSTVLQYSTVVVVRTVVYHFTKKLKLRHL